MHYFENAHEIYSTHVCILNFAGTYLKVSTLIIEYIVHVLKIFYYFCMSHNSQYVVFREQKRDS